LSTDPKSLISLRCNIARLSEHLWMEDKEIFRGFEITWAHAKAKLHVVLHWLY